MRHRRSTSLAPRTCVVFERLRARGEAVATESCNRPWGQSIILSTTELSARAPACREKLLRLDPGAGIGLEFHTGYTEVWIPEERFRFAREDAAGTFETGWAEPAMALHIPPGRRHKLFNPNATPVWVYEIQIGVIVNGDKTLCAEDDPALDLRI